jgi:hypothetical protein
VVLVGAVVLTLGGELPPVVTAGDVDEHAAPSAARATTHAASPARRRGIHRSVERDRFMLVAARFVIPVGTGGSPVPIHRDRDIPQPAPCRSPDDHDVLAGSGIEPDGDAGRAWPAAGGGGGGSDRRTR